MHTAQSVLTPQASSLPAPPAGNRQWWSGVVLLGVLVAITGCLLIRPGDAPFFYDESVLMRLAMDWNRAHGWAPHGLLGTHHVHYGPTAVWIYQLIVRRTHDLPTVVVIRTALFMIGTAGALLWIAQTLRWQRWVIPILLLSPYMYFYARQPWDNTFGIPLGTLLVAAYASFLHSAKGWKLLLVACCCVLLLMVHLMTAPLVLAVAIHALVFRARDLLHLKWWVGASAILATLLTWNYAQVVIGQLPGHSIFPCERTQGLLLWLGAGRNFSGIEIDYIVFYGWANARLGDLRPLIWSTAMPYALVWLGVALGLAGCRRSVRPWLWTPGQQTLSLLIIAVAIHGAMCIGQGLLRFPHYNNGMWAVHAMLIWAAADALVRRTRLAWIPLAIHAALLLSLTALIAHRASTDRAVSPVAEHMAMVQQLARLPAGAEVRTDIPESKHYRPQLEMVARMMRLPLPRWTDSPEASYVIGLDKSRPELPRPVLTGK